MKTLFFAIALLFIHSCNYAQKNKLTGNNIELFQNSPVWLLAQAVKIEDTLKISELLSNELIKKNINYQDSTLGFTLLHWAVFNEKYYSMKSLLNHGAAIHIKTKYSGTCTMHVAADNNNTSVILELLLKNGGDPNIEADSIMAYRIGTPLIAAAGSNLENVKLLINAGANINHIFKKKRNAITSAIISEKVEILHLLIIEKKAEFVKPQYLYKPDDYFFSKPFVELLRDWVYPLDSKEYKMKMEIVDYLKSQGYDYWKTEPSNYVKKNYPKSFWKVY